MALNWPMLAAAIPFPDISPEIVSITFGGINFALRWYALAYIVGILGGWWLTMRMVRSPRLWSAHPAPMGKTEVDELLTWMILGIILGGRLGYVMFYDPALYLAAPVDALKIWEGGMSFHGGVLGTAVAIYGFHRRFGIALLPMADVLAVATPFGLMLGRIANFINAELWGRPTDLLWGVIFPGHAAQACGQVAGEICARHPSQLYEAALEGLVLGAVLLWLALRRGGFGRPGFLLGVYLAGYAMARFVVEFVRVADEQFVTPENPIGNVVHVGSAGLSMGQLLSLPMFLIGLWLIIRSQRAADATA